jgi:hypothetical protein
MVPENMQLGETATMILTATVILLLLALLILKIRSNKRDF